MANWESIRFLVIQILFISVQCTRSFVHRLAKMPTQSGNVRKNLRTLGIYYNEDAVVVLTDKKLPIYLKVVASLGKNFSYVPRYNAEAAVDMLTCLAKLSGHMAEDVMVEPGLVMIFAHGVSE